MSITANNKNVADDQLQHFISAPVHESNIHQTLLQNNARDDCFQFLLCCHLVQMVIERIQTQKWINI